MNPLIIFLKIIRSLENVGDLELFALFNKILARCLSRRIVVVQRACRQNSVRNEIVQNAVVGHGITLVGEALAPEVKPADTKVILTSAMGQ